MSGHVRSEVNARKFYSERNMYLCGFTLFLSLILNRTYVMILDELRLREEIKTLKGGAKDGKDSPEVALLKKQLEAAKSDLATMKKQAENLQREYNRLGDEKSLSDAAPKKDR
jgi:B-cell receptor-associated protein 31